MFRSKMLVCAMMSLVCCLIIGSAALAAPAMSGLNGWYQPETLAAGNLETWTDSSGAGNTLYSYAGGMPTAVGVNGYRYADFTHAFNYARLQTGNGTDITPGFATGMNSTEFDVFVVVMNKTGGDLGTISPDPINSNNEKASFGLRGQNWMAVWGGTNFSGIGTGRQGGGLYGSEGAARWQTTAPSNMIYEGVLGATALDTDTIINGVGSTVPVEGAPNWWGSFNAAPFNPVDRSIMIGYNFASLKGNLYEVLVYNRKLTDAERNQTGLYLADKYGLQTAYVPEPGSMLALGSGLLGLAGFVIRRRK